VQFFYQGLTQSNRSMIESMNGGAFLSLTGEEAYRTLDQLSDKSQQWDFSSCRDKAACIQNKIPEGVRTVNCNCLSKIALKASITRPLPDGCTSAARNYHNKALSVRTLKTNVRTVELVHAISIYDACSSGP
jgi:hypothetical protein